MNTPLPLRKSMQEKGIEETAAATSFGGVSKKVVLNIKKGKLHKRQTAKPDINLEDNSPAANDALKGLDPIWIMIAMKYSIPPGESMSKNE